MSHCRSDRWSNFDKYSTSTLQRYPLRSKSPYRSTSSLSRSSSTSNLKIEDDYFNALNKSLGAHDANFIHKEEDDETGSYKNDFGGHSNEWRYNSLNRPSKKYGSDKYGGSKINKSYGYGLNDDDDDDIGKGKTYSYSYKYNDNNDNDHKLKSYNIFDKDDYGGSKFKYGSSTYDNNDLDKNNNDPYHYSTSITAKVTYDSDPDDNDKPYFKYTTTTTTTTNTRSGDGGKPNYRLSTKSATNDYYALDNHNDNASVESDESMSEYMNCKSFYPDSLSESKLFHGIRTSPSILEQQHQHHLANHSSPTHHQSQSSSINGSASVSNANSLANTAIIDDNIQFVPIVKIREQQAIRTAEFHPNGKYYAVGSNSKLLRLFRYSSQINDNNDSSSRNGNDYRNNQSLLELKRAEEIFARTNYHRSSIYCLTWNKMGNLLATGSNDKTVKLLPFNPNTELAGNESEINVHNGTIRDICFMDDLTNGSSLLLSGGAGDCKIYITDCVTGTTFLSLSGHSSDILSMYTWGGAMFVSGSKDRTIRFWDLRTNSCINFVTCPTISRNKPGGAVSSVCVDPTGKLLVSGHEDSTCMLYDIRGGRVIQTFHPHTADIRTIRFSPKAYCLLTGSYDNNIALTDLKGDLTQPLQSIIIASHQDKVIQCRWHPEEWTFLSTSADKSVMLWTLPE